MTSTSNQMYEQGILDGNVHSIRQELHGILLFIGAIWASYFLSHVTSIEEWGLVPRHLAGLVGIGTMTFLHGNLQHLIGNTIPLFVLLSLLAGSRASTWSVVTFVVAIGGVLLWLFGRPGSHQGASLLIFGLISFLIASGLYFERRVVPMLVTLLVVFMYGITLVTGMVPRFWGNGEVSWEGHLCGAIAGVLAAYLLSSPQHPNRFSDADAGATHIRLPKI